MSGNALLHTFIDEQDEVPIHRDPEVAQEHFEDIFHTQVTHKKFFDLKSFQIDDNTDNSYIALLFFKIISGENLVNSIPGNEYQKVMMDPYCRCVLGSQVSEYVYISFHRYDFAFHTELLN